MTIGLESEANLQTPALQDTEIGRVRLVCFTVSQRVGSVKQEL